MTHFIKHQPCPKCHSRDNLAVYADGHEWCFGCSYYKPPSWSLEKVRKKQIKEEPLLVGDFHCDLSFVNSIPKEPLHWLKKYGILDEEIETYCIQWDEKRELLAFPIKKDGQITGFVCRNFGPSRHERKYLYYGTRDVPPKICAPSAQKTIGIFVEDMISAIKVGRSFVGLPVLSANIDLGALHWAQAALHDWTSYGGSLKDILTPPSSFKRVGIWLDRDMHGKVNRTVTRGNLFFGEGFFFPIYTKKDPKEYNDKQIKDIVEVASKCEK